MNYSRELKAPLQKLISISSHALADTPVRNESPTPGVAVKLWNQLIEILAERNGFFTFENALHVFPSANDFTPHGLEWWNHENTWKKDYGTLTNGMLFFAQDIFGMQYAMKNDGVYFFDSETAALEPFAGDLSEWAAKILEDYNLHTGHSLAHEWQLKHGAIPTGKRLAPNIPFVAGGAFELSNLHLADAFELMQFRGMLAQKIKNLPNGAKISFKVVE